ncbi:MAG: 30S ribosomal protein S9 [Patescibacteria group bacterium]
MKEEKKKSSLFEGKYFYAVGRRKSAVSKVKLFETPGKDDVIVNGRKLEDYFGILRLQMLVREPFEKLGREKQFSVETKIVGGGISAQAEALRLGIARSLVLVDEGTRKVLKDLKLLTRDPRVVERKKAGLKKARRSPQWAKR